MALAKFRITTNQFLIEFMNVEVWTNFFFKDPWLLGVYIVAFLTYRNRSIQLSLDLQLSLDFQNIREWAQDFDLNTGASKLLEFS